MKSFLFQASFLLSLCLVPGHASTVESSTESKNRDLSPDIESMFGEENDHQIYDQEVDEARFLELMSMPTSDICDAVYECPDSCDCNGNVQDGTQEICECYDITSVHPPFDTYVLPPSGTWYCFQLDLDKTAEGCSGAKQGSFSFHSCHWLF
jgi:hypothetical protein